MMCCPSFVFYYSILLQRVNGLLYLLFIILLCVWCQGKLNIAEHSKYCFYYENDVY